PRPVRRQELQGIVELLTEAWTVFQRRFATLFATYLLSLVATLLPPALGAGLGFALGLLLPGARGLLVVLLSAVGGLIGLAGLFWGGGACVAATLDQSLDYRGAFAYGRKKLFSFALVGFLTGFVVTGGYLLLVIPGVIFSVWFVFAQFVLFDDDTRGMSALLKSKAYVSDRWFDVFLRLVVIWVCSAVVGAIPAVGPLLTLVAVPYVMVYHALVFQDLKEVTGPPAFFCGFSDRARWVAIALVGYIVLPATILALFGASLYRSIAPFTGGIASLRRTIPAAKATSTEGYRVIPIPPSGVPPTSDQPSPVTPEPGASPAAQGETGHPSNVHVFIYAVNYAGSVKANGVTIQELGTKPDMQYNYNLGGEKLQFGRNGITVDYTPIKEAGATMSPRIHVKVSFWKGSERQVLGDWEISETEAGQKSFDVDIPESPKGS
ncbi:MAG TPA: hypothetical protein VI389_09190, partial [Geobacteraceae bacterium]